MIKKLLLSCLFTAAVITAKAQVVPNTDWVNTFGNAMSNTLVAVANALDANQNVYVTGYSYNGSDLDFVVLKYDSISNLLWSAVEDNGLDDVGKAITFDASGNVYVTGLTVGSTNKDYFTVKYNASGVKQWSAIHDGLGSGNDVAVSVKVDASGNVYIAGTTNNGMDDDITTICYTSGGTVSWTNDFDLSGDYDTGVAMVLSSDNNTVYVTGNAGIGGGLTDIGVLALDAANGNLNWFNNVDGSSNSNDVSSGIVLTGADVVVCGKLTNTDEDYVVLRMDGTNGNVVYSTSYDFSTTDFATGLVRDSTGNIAITGMVNNSGTIEYHTLLYDSTGSQLFLNTESINAATAYVQPKIACDTIAHHFYVSGEKQRSSYDAYVYQITPGGNTSWEHYIDGSGNAYDAAVNLSVNGIGVVYLAGLSTNTASTYQLSTIKISQTPVYFPPDPTGESYSNEKLFYENKGQIVNDTFALVPEVLYYNHMTGPEYYIQKDRVSYVHRRMDTVSTNNDTLQRIDVRFYDSNPLAVAYDFLPTYTEMNYFLPHCGTNGITGVKGNQRLMVPNLWRSIDLNYYSNNNGIKYYFVVKPGASPNNIVLDIAGASSAAISGSDLILSNTIGTVNLGEVYGYQVSYVGGTYSINALPSAVSWTALGSNQFGVSVPSYSLNLPLVIMVYVPNVSPNSVNLYNMNYSTFYGGGGNESFSNIKVRDSDNTRYICGHTNSNSFPSFQGLFSLFKGQTDVVLLKYAGTDSLKFATFYGGTGEDYPAGVEVKSNGNIYLVGNTKSLDLPINANIRTSADQQTVNAYYQPSSYSSQADGFILELNNKGDNHRWSRYFGGIIEETFYDIALDKTDNLYICGKSNSCNYPKKNSLKFGPSQCQFGTNWDMVVTKMDSTCKLVFSTFYGGDTHQYFSVPGSPTLNIDAAYAIDVDTSGYFYVVGQTYKATNDLSPVNLTGNTATTSIYNSTMTGDGGVLIRFTPSDSVDFFTEIGATGTSINDVKVLPDQNVLMCGVTSATSSTFPLKTAGSSYNRTIGGTTNKGFISMVDPSLNNLWTTHFSYSNFSSWGLYKIAVADNNSFFISGTANCDSVTLATTNPSNVYVKNAYQWYDGFISYFSNVSSAYNFIYSHWLGGTSIDYSNDIDVYQASQLYVTGHTYSGDYPTGYTGNLALIDQTQNEGQDGYVTRFDLSAVPVVSVRENIRENPLQISLYPNPVNDVFVVNLAELQNKKTIKLSVHNALGQLVFEDNLANFNDELLKVNCNNWTNGFYVVSVNSDGKQYSAKIIKQ